jgi:hypothetical protein
MPSVPIALAGILGLAALGLKIVDFLRLLTNMTGPDGAVNRTSAITQAIAWAVFVGLVFLYAQSQYASTVVIDGVSLGKADWPTLVLIGLALGSAAGVLKSYLAARDNTQTAAVPGFRVPRRRSVPEPPAQVEVNGHPTAPTSSVPKRAPKHR